MTLKTGVKISLGVLFFVLLGGAIYGFYALLTTPVGLQWFAQRLQAIMPETIQIQEIKGTLLGPIEIKNFHFRNNKFDITVQNLYIKWQPKQLIVNNRLWIDEFKANELIVKKLIKENKLPNLSPPLPFTLKKSNINFFIFYQEPHEILQIDQLQLTAQTKTGRKKEKFAVVAQWKKADLHLPAHSHLLSQQGSFYLGGTAKRYQFEIDTPFTTSLGLKGLWHTQGNGNQTSLHFNQILVDTLDGNLKGSGDLILEPELNWLFNIQANKLNPSLAWSTWPGKINFFIHSNGSEINQKLKAKLDINPISGTLDNARLSGEFHLAIDDNNFVIDHSQLQLNKSTFEITGWLKNIWNLNWKINIPNLGSFSEKISGNISSTGQVIGPRSMPIIRGNFEAHNIFYPSGQLDHLSATAYIDLKSQGPVLFNFVANNLKIGSELIKKARIDLSGQTTHHTIDMTLQEPNRNLLIHMIGKLQDGTWQSQLTEFNLVAADFGHWQLRQPSTLHFSKTQRNMSPLCLTSATQQLCLSSQWQKNKSWNFNFNLINLNLNPFIKFFKPNYNLDSKFNLDATFIKSDNGNIQGHANATLTPGKFGFAIDSKKYLVSFAGSKLDAVLNKTGMNINTVIDLYANQALILKLNFPHFGIHGFLNKNQPINGNMHLHFHQFDLLTALYPRLRNVSGQFSSDMNIGGRLNSPTLTGKALLQKGTLSIPRMGLNIREINIQAQGDPTGKIALNGVAQSGKGKLFVNGSANFAQKQLSTTLKLTGSDVEMINTPKYKFIVSPDISLQLVGTNVTLYGSLLVPVAAIALTELDNEDTELTSDVIFISKNQDQLQSSTLFKLNGQINVKMGNNVLLTRAGLKGQLVGELWLNFLPPALMTTQGQLHLLHGQYAAYGQTLTVRQGDFVYAGGSIDNPGLILQAVRSVVTSKRPSVTPKREIFLPTAIRAGVGNKVIVGVNVTGTVKHHQLRLFSEPPIYSQSDILSMILLGQPTNEAGGTGAQTVLQAAASLNLGGSQINSITEQIQQSFGLSELGIESAAIPGAPESSDTTSLVLEKPITQNLFIGYSIGLLNPISVFSIRWAINDNWSLQTESSALGSGIDLFYSVEK